MLPRPIAWAHWGVSVAVLGLLIRSLQKVEWAQFRNIANIVVVDIAQHGPDRQKHEAFVDRVMMQIELARQEMIKKSMIKLEFPPEDPPGYLYPPRDPSDDDDDDS